MHIAEMLNCAYLQEQTQTNTTEYQIFQLQQEARSYKEIEEVDLALHVRLSENLLKNSLAIKKWGAALFKMASVKEVVKSKGAAKKWL